MIILINILAVIGAIAIVGVILCIIITVNAQEVDADDKVIITGKNGRCTANPTGKVTGPPPNTRGKRGSR